MKLIVKLSLIIAAALVILGSSIFVIAMSINGWDFKKLGSANLTTQTYELSGDFSNIQITAMDEEIVFLPSEDDNLKVVCTERNNVAHSLSISDGTLEIIYQDDRAFPEKLFNFATEKMTVYLPATEYQSLTITGDTCDITIPKDFSFNSLDISVSTGDTECYASVTDTVKITASTGDIELKNTSVGSLYLKVSTGEITIESVTCLGSVEIKVSTGDTELIDLTCESLLSTGNTGDIELERVIVSGKLEIERTTGDIEFSHSDAGEIIIETSTGDVSGSLLSNKVFTTKTHTGKVNVPNSSNGGKCEITTDTGKIIIEIVS